MSIGLSLIISTGPNVQLHLTSLLGATHSSIYSASYQESISQYIPYRLFISQAIYPFFIIMAVVIASLSILAYCAVGHFFIWITLVSWLVLTLGDVYLNWIDPDLKLDFTLNIVLNFFGAASVSVLVGFCLVIGTIAARFVPITMISFAFLSAFFMTCAGINLFIYLTIDLFYKPTPVVFRLSTVRPVSGIIISDPLNKKDLEEPSGASGNLIPSEATLEGFSFRSNSVSKVQFKPTLESRSVTYELQLALLKGCVGTEKVPNLVFDYPLNLSTHEPLSVSVDAGYTT
jgi:hypothetical protein